MFRGSSFSVNVDVPLVNRPVSVVSGKISLPSR